MKCVYLANQKAACSTLKLAMSRWELRQPEYTPTKIHKDKALLDPIQFGWDRTVQWLSSKDVFIFTFVRDPRTRILSAYFDKIAPRGSRSNQPFRTEVQKLLGLDIEQSTSISFDQFLDAIEREDDPRMLNPHWRPQHLNTLHKLVRTDFVGAIEKFDEDLDELKRLANLPDIPIEVRNQRQKIAEDLLSGRADRRRRIESIYAGDFEAFGYQ